MAKEAVSKAVQDAAISYNDFEQAFVGYVYGTFDADLILLAQLNEATDKSGEREKTLSDTRDRSRMNVFL